MSGGGGGGKTLFLLFESASGFALLEAKPLDAIGMSIAQVSARHSGKGRKRGDGCMLQR